MSVDRTIFRVGSRSKPYSQISNAMIRDGRLSWEARMVLIFVLSFPDNWEFSFKWLMEQPPGFGRDRLKRHIAELVQYGYCQRARERQQSGAFGTYAYVFTDDPQVVDNNPNQQLGTSNWNPVTGDQSHSKKESQKKNHKDPPLPPRGRGGRSSKLKSDKQARPARAARFVSEEALDRVRSVAPGWDRQFLLTKFLEWPKSANARDLDAAFLGWAKTFTKGKTP